MPPERKTGDNAFSKSWRRQLASAGLRTIRFLHHGFRAATDSVTRRFFLAAYEASDDLYWRKCAASYEWRSLGGIIEFTPEFLAVSGTRAAPVYLIAVRAASNTRLERVTIKIKVKKSGVIHQQEITQRHLCDIPVRKALTSIPLKPKLSEGVDRHRLGDIYIKLSKAVDSEGVDLSEGNKFADIFPATGTNSGSHNQVERWGQHWNVEAINLHKDDIKARYYRELVHSARKLGRPLALRKLGYRLLTGKPGLSLVFWSRNLWDAKGMRASIAQEETAGPAMGSAKRRTATA